MSKKKKDKQEAAAGEPAAVVGYQADTEEFQQQLWKYLSNMERLSNRCTSSVRAIVEMCRKSEKWLVEDTKDGPLCYLDRGGDVLTVAHIDTVGHKSHFFFGNIEGAETYVFSPWLDDRLGAFIILDVLPKLGTGFDVLLCTNEEHGASTGKYFQPPKDKKYRYLAEFDRMGEDIVNYQYNQPDMTKALKAAGFPHPSHGSYTDIVELEHLGVAAFNVAVGYEQPHTKWCRANLMATYRQLIRFFRFSEATTGITFPFTDQSLNNWPRRGGRGRSGAAPNGSLNNSNGAAATPSQPNSGNGGLPGATAPLTASYPEPFPFVQGEKVVRTHGPDKNRHVWRIDKLGAWNATDADWYWAISRTEKDDPESKGSALWQSAALQKDLALLFEPQPGLWVSVSLLEWKLAGRPANWKNHTFNRLVSLSTLTINGRAFPRAKLNDIATRLLWESHGSHFNTDVKQARREFEELYFYRSNHSRVYLVHHSTEPILGEVPGFYADLPNGAPLPYFHFNDQVEVPRLKCGGVIACISPVILSDGELWYWVDTDKPDQNGATLELFPEDDLVLIEVAAKRWGKYTPEKAVSHSLELLTGMTLPAAEPTPEKEPTHDQP